MIKKDITWGSATASYQIEGAAYSDGRGLSVWDEFCLKDGAIENGDNGDFACDSYNRLDEDINIMKEIGIQAYRFSLSWTRILPNGTGEINQAGIDYYNRVINKLLENGIEPYITLFHWDYPEALFNKGGWLNPQSPDWMEEFAGVAAQNFSDRVKYWITSNEAQCYIGIGHGIGCHAPGLKLSKYNVVKAWHNNLVALGKATQAIRNNARGEVKVGIVSCGEIGIPASDLPQDIEAARKVLFNKKLDGEFINFGFGELLEPAINGVYPENLKGYLPDGWERDMDIIKQPLDFVGLNVYTGQITKATHDGDYEYINPIVGEAITATDWKVRPESMYWVIKFIWEKYKLPIVIAENGMANNDWMSIDMKVHDPQRIDYMDRYIGQLLRAANEGANVQAYFHWSLMDNFEWSCGYKRRFGLVYVDYKSFKRTLKDSAYHYREIIKSNGKIVEEIEVKD